MDTQKKYITKSFSETQKLGKNLAKEMLVSGLKNSAMVLALQGELGAGKTTFLQGFAKGLGIKENVLSPTFIVMKRFSLKGNSFKNFYHFDLYRLNSAEEILHLGFREIISNPENIVAIEWPEKIKKMLPKNVIKIIFAHHSHTQRSLKISGNGL